MDRVPNPPELFTMLVRLALVLGGLASAGTIALALALGEATPATTDAAAAQPVAASPAASPTPIVQIDTVYVPAPAPPQTVVVHREVGGGHGEHEGDHETGEHEGGDG